MLLPGVLPGNYHILVRADVANQEKEGADKANNLADSGPVAIGVHALTTDGTVASGLLTTADPGDYFSVQVSDGQNLGLVLSGLSASGSNELYVSIGAIPTRASFDFAARNDETQSDNRNQRLALTAPAGGGTFYVLVYGAVIDPSDNPYSLAASTGTFVLTGVTPDRGSNLAQTPTGGTIPDIVTLSGAGFDDSTVVEFVSQDGTVFDPTTLTVDTPSTITLDLDLPTWPAGTYDVRVSSGSTSETLQEAFRVVAGGLPHLETNLIVPSSLGVGLPVKQTIWIEYSNTGDAAMPAPLLELQAQGDQNVRMTTDSSIAIPQAGYGVIPRTSDTIQVIALGSSDAVDSSTW